MNRAIAEDAWIGALYGTTTFLPVSRGGHLALAELLFETGRPEPHVRLGLLLGAFVATLFVVRQSLVRLGPAIAVALRRPATLSTTHAGRDLRTMVLSQLPVLLVALFIGDEGELVWRHPTMTGVGFFLTALVLLSTAWAGRGNELQPTLVQSLLLGFGQSFGLFPGLSMTACTIALAMWFGLTARRSFELAMLVSLPTTAFAMARTWGACSGAAIPVLAMTMGVLASLGTGMVAGKLLRAVVVRGQIAWFSMWVAPLAVATFAFARAWPGR